MEELLTILNELEFTIGSVESFTAGKFAASIGQYPGVSSIYRGSLITYHSDIKEKLLNISRDTIESYGVVSNEVATQMATSGREILGVDICVSFTGNAGPTVIENKEVGQVYIGIDINDDINIFSLHLKGSRGSIQNQAIEFVIKQLKEKLKANYCIK